MVIGKLGPDWFRCLKCGADQRIQTSGSPILLMQKVGSEPTTGPTAIKVHSKACRECGFVELYCPDAIGDD